jgi:hypothetical protein
MLEMRERYYRRMIRVEWQLQYTHIIFFQLLRVGCYIMHISDVVDYLFTGKKAAHTHITRSNYGDDLV